MKFIHTSDWHVAASKFLGSTYLDRQLGVLDAIAETALDRGVNVIVVAGDIYDNNEPDPEEQERFLERILAYDRMGLTILAIRGNHDTSSHAKSSLRTLDHMCDYGVFSHSVITETTKWVRVQDTLFLLLCHRPRFFQEDLEAELRRLAESSVVPPHKHVVAVVHETFRGTITDTNWRLQHGEDVKPLDVGETIPNLNLTYVAAGDIHICQRISDRAWYSGAPLQVKYGDRYPKGVLLVDTDDPDSPEFIPIHSKKLVVVHAREDGTIPVPEEDVHVKVFASPKVYAAAREQGHIPEGTRFQAVKDDVTLAFANTDLRSKIMEGLEQILTGEDLDIAKREAQAVLAQAQVST